MSDSLSWQVQDFKIFKTKAFLLGAALKSTVLILFLESWTDPFAGLKLLLLLLFDSLTFWQLVRFFPTKEEKILAYYWWSPVVILIAYTQGSTTLIAAALFFFGLARIIRDDLEVGVASVLIAAVIQPELTIAIPMALLFVYKKRLPIRRLAFTGTGFVLGGFALVAAARSFKRNYIEESIESCLEILTRFPVPLSYELSESPTDGLSENLPIYIGSAAIIGCMIKFSAFRKTNRDILILYSGVILTLCAILAPAAPSLLLLAFPFFVYLFVGNSDLSRLPFLLLVVAGCGYGFALHPEGAQTFAAIGAGVYTTHVFPTLLVATLLPAIVLMLEVGARSNEELRRSEQPLLVGIAGDSASGKHTLLKIIQALVGEDQCVSIFGDDFHRWERDDQNWKQHTHLDPRANRLHDGAEVAMALRDGESVEVAHYDHATGRFGDPKLIVPKRFICFVGLHPFFLSHMRSLIDIKIFVDIDEGLRRTRKIRRDVIKRGHTAEEVIEQIESRTDDHSQYIGPQKEFADLVIRYEPLEPIDSYLNLDADSEVDVLTSYRMSNGIDLEELVARLREMPTLSVQHFSSIEFQDLRVSGTLTLDEVVDIASELKFNFDELHINPSDWVKRWIAGHNGISQLVFLHVYNHRMKAHSK